MDVPTSSPIDTHATIDECQWALFAHLGGLIAASVSATSMGFVAPLIIWLIKKDQSRFIDDQAKEALNFQVSVLIATALLVTVGGVISFVTFGLGALLVIPAAAALAIYALVMPIVAAIRSNKGELYRYPLTLRLIK
ncbi:MAG TPA: DUF4870 domain-containing protein [Planctomycetaceae bacterium]|jgi:uncharacterized Tic20 family protein|nr:DUF4870 domain-containing protein [Planctomycetaceae bacterium]